MYIYIYTYTNLFTLHIFSPTAQEPCTEIINSAVADVADMAHVTDGNPDKRCAVLCGLARIPHANSEASPRKKYICFLGPNFFVPKNKSGVYTQKSEIQNDGSWESLVSDLKWSALG